MLLLSSINAKVIKMLILCYDCVYLLLIKVDYLID